MMLLTLLLAISLQLESPCAILINADSGAILYQKNANEQRDPASTTKIATCLYALSRKPDMNQIVIGDQECIGIISEKERLKRGWTEPPWRLEKAACHMGIKAGEALTLRDLFNGMMIASADDASNLIAETISGSIPRFMEELNLYLNQIGCNNTNFLNPHGLYHPQHKSTAHDLAQMTRVAMKHPYFCAIVQAEDFMRPKTNMQEPAKYLQTNRLLRAGKHRYPHAIGVKTGWFSSCGYCLVAAAEKEGRKLIAVLLGAPSSDTRFQEAIALFEAAFSEKPSRQELLRPGRQAQAIDHPSGKKRAFLKTLHPLSFESYPSEKESYQISFEWVGEESGKYSVTDAFGNSREEVVATVDEWVEEHTPLSWAYLSLLALPAGYLLWKKKP